jgi:hypothetical protein
VFSIFRLERENRSAIFMPTPNDHGMPGDAASRWKCLVAPREISSDATAPARDLGIALEPTTERYVALGSCLLLLAIIVVTILRLIPGDCIGDGNEYYAMVVNWAEGLRPYGTEQTGRIYDTYQTRSDGKWRNIWSNALLKEVFAPFRNSKDQQDYSHFWFYSLLVAVFYWPVKLVHANIGLSFSLFHCTLLLLCAWVIKRRLGWLGVLALILLVAGSPAIWYINKAHTEFFTVLVTITAVALLLTRDYVASSIWFALASTQNPPFAIICLMVLALGFADQRWQLFRRNPGLLVLLGFLLCLHPGYSWFRLGVLTPLLVGPGNNVHAPLSLRAMTSFWIDPDTGLLPNWPYACPILLAFAILLVRRRVPILTIPSVASIASLVIFSWSQSRNTNLNHGGVLDVSRYATWYLCLFFPLVFLMLRWMFAEKPRWCLAGSACAVLLMLLNVRWFNPDKPAHYVSPSPASYYIYAYYPGLYDPVPEIFMERYAAGKAEGWVRRSCWAVGHPCGNKILVTARALELLDDAKVPPVAGCEWVDPLVVRDLGRAALMAKPGHEYVYLNGWGQTLLHLRSATREALAIRGNGSGS